LTTLRQRLVTCFVLIATSFWGGCAGPKGGTGHTSVFTATANFAEPLPVVGWTLDFPKAIP
jgi:hypothetical protein